MKTQFEHKTMTIKTLLPSFTLALAAALLAAAPAQAQQAAATPATAATATRCVTGGR